MSSALAYYDPLINIERKSILGKFLIRNIIVEVVQLEGQNYTGRRSILELIA